MRLNGPNEPNRNRRVEGSRRINRLRNLCWKNTRTECGKATAASKAIEAAVQGPNNDGSNGNYTRVAFGPGSWRRGQNRERGRHLLDSEAEAASLAAHGASAKPDARVSRGGSLTESATRVKAQERRQGPVVRRPGKVLSHREHTPSHVLRVPMGRARAGG